ncbi:MAG TPA: dihydroorotate dehydrogenase [Planctomycetota bacterium]|jgi:dihydroorotate dehydrogenase (NAD+) catalytic subunit|nr:dihydroorotate dehydrogenase [Planctomycetota bacterium]
MVDLSVELASLALRNPILSASGTFGHGLEMEHFSSPGSMGGLVSKTVTLRPRPGNPAPRIHETEVGFLNSIGLENHGIEAYLREVLPRVADADTCIFTNIGGEAEQEFAELAGMLDEREEVDALEINLSCPNVGGGRLPYSTDPALAERVVRGVREATTKPIFAKLSPNVTRIGDIARGVEAGGADGLTAVNTLLGMAVDWRSRRPRVATVQGGYSGTGIKPVALRCAWECARAVSIPVIGCGGVGDAQDVLEFLVVGCSAVQVGTAAFADPALPGVLAERVATLLDAEGIASVRELIGALEDGREETS